MGIRQIQHEDMDWIKLLQGCVCIDVGKICKLCSLDKPLECKISARQFARNFSSAFGVITITNGFLKADM